MVERITKSGVYDLDMAAYRGQPADAMSISSSDAQILTESTPAHLKSSWDEPDDGSAQADFGTVIHTLLLEPHRTHAAVVVIDAENYTKGGKEAREARDAAYKAGQTPILKKDFERAQAAVQAVQRHPVAAALLKQGRAEPSLFAKDKATGLYRKARPDFMNSARIMLDIKTVGSASPEFLQRRVYDGGWFQQAPWHLEVAEQVEGEPVRGYCWIIVEQKPPHCVVVRKPTDTMIMHGDRLNKRAFAIFARCVKENCWPGWSDSIEDLSLPSYALFRLEEDGVVNEKNDGMQALRWAQELGADPRL